MKHFNNLSENVCVLAINIYCCKALTRARNENKATDFFVHRIQLIQLKKIHPSSINLFPLVLHKFLYQCKDIFKVLTLERRKEFSPLPSFALRLPSLGLSLDPALSFHAQSGICTLEWGQDLASHSETQNCLKIHSYAETNALMLWCYSKDT